MFAVLVVVLVQEVGGETGVLGFVLLDDLLLGLEAFCFAAAEAVDDVLFDLSDVVFLHSFHFLLSADVLVST